MCVYQTMEQLNREIEEMRQRQVEDKARAAEEKERKLNMPIEMDINIISGVFDELKEFYITAILNMDLLANRKNTKEWDTLINKMCELGHKSVMASMLLPGIMDTIILAVEQKRMHIANEENAVKEGDILYWVSQKGFTVMSGVVLSTNKEITICKGTSNFPTSIIGSKIFKTGEEAQVRADFLRSREE